MKKICIPALILSFYFPVLGYAASFDCSKAASWTEQMICGDAPLSRMDDRMAVTYKQAFEVLDKNMLKTTQLAWIKKQRACKDIMCLRDLYTARSDELYDLIIKSSPSSVGKLDSANAKNLSQDSVKKQLTFKLVDGDPLPLCQPYVDMLNATKYIGYSELACGRKILPQFSQFKTVNWTEIKDKNEMVKFLKERTKINIAHLSVSAQNSNLATLDEFVTLIHNDEMKMYFFKDDLDKDGADDIAYKTVQIYPNVDESKICKDYRVNYFDDKKTTLENAKQRYPSSYFAFQLSSDNELFYFKDTIYNSYWGYGVITAGSNIDIYAVGNKKICGILGQ